MEGVYDAAVLGAGVAGASLAAALAARGWRVLAVDRDTFPRHKVCGEFLSPEARAMLAAAGADPAARTAGPAAAAITRARLYPAGGAPLETALPGTAYGLSRYALDAALHEAARRAGAEVAAGTAVTGVAASGRGWRVELRESGGARTAEARVAVAAWGRSPRGGLPGGAGARAGSVPGPAYVGFKFHMAEPGGGTAAVEPVVELYFAPQGYLGFAPVEAGRTNVAGLLTLEAFRAAGGTVRSAARFVARRHPACLRRLEAAAPVPGTACAVAPVAAACLPEAWDALPRIGDAAAFIPPLCGDGMAMALRSAQLCAELADGVLRGRLTPDEWRRRYRAELRRQFAAPVRWGRLLQTCLQQPAPSLLLGGLARLVPALPPWLVQATRLRD
jgi:flavin-dependent dehydrogenase